MSMFHTGLGGLNKNPISLDTDQPQRNQLTFPAQVIDICMGTTHNLFESQKDIGKIRFRNLISQVNKPEDLCTMTAYPLDRSIARYPFPGEEVIVFEVIGERETVTGPIVYHAYFYSFVVSMMHNVTANPHPFIGTNFTSIDPNKLFPVKSTEEKRFDAKIIHLEMLKPLGSKDIEIRRQLQPHEGDFILQGRFGNTIRMAGTSVESGTNWSKEGLPGSGIIMFRVDTDSTMKMEDMLIEEDINSDDASIYMCTTQKIPFDLNCSKFLSTWTHVYGLKKDKDGKSIAGIASKKDNFIAAWAKDHRPSEDSPITFGVTN